MAIHEWESASLGSPRRGNPLKMNHPIMTPNVDSPGNLTTGFYMKSTVSISEGQDSFPALVKAAEKGSVITVTRHDLPVACVIGHERMSAIAETLEIMGNAAAMAAIAEHKAGRTSFGRIDEIPD